MEQLSKIGFHAAHRKYKDIEMYHELCAYQDTGLTPEQITVLQAENEQLEGADLALESLVVEYERLKARHERLRAHAEKAKAERDAAEKAFQGEMGRHQVAVAKLDAAMKFIDELHSFLKNNHPFADTNLHTSTVYQMVLDWLCTGNGHSDDYNRIKAKAETWPDWKKETYNVNFATSKHAKKLEPRDNQ